MYVKLGRRIEKCIYLLLLNWFMLVPIDVYIPYETNRLYLMRLSKT